MRKAIYIGLTVFVLAGCASKRAPLVDDVYYWPDPVSTATVPGTTSSLSAPGSTKADSTVIEYINVQDTTITVRIKR